MLDSLPCSLSASIRSGLVTVPFAVIGLLMVGELYVFVTGDN